MQIKHLHRKSYRMLRKVVKCHDELAGERQRIIENYDMLINSGVDPKSALKVIGVSRATMYRWKKKQREHGYKGIMPVSRSSVIKRKPTWHRSHEKAVLGIRQRYPLWGKKKIQVMLAREDIRISVSMVGRILKKLIQLGRIKPVRHYYGRLKDVRHRKFNRYAKRWRYKDKKKGPGQMVQIDHMSVPLSGTGRTVKHFDAICSASKFIAAKAHWTASSRVAASFLDHVIESLQVKVSSIQVDGGSEFMKEFEKACEEKGIELYVLPPRSPKLNGCVERCNRTIKYEFYRLYEEKDCVHEVNKELAKYL